jgi:hypothetical protein
MPEAIPKYFGAILILVMTLLTPNAKGQTPRYDLLLKGGHVIDPANHLDGLFDVAVFGGKIAFLPTRPGRWLMFRASSSRRAS